MRWTLFGMFGIGLVGVASASLADDAADASFFETKVRPLLVAKCLECHGSEKPKAGLRLDSRDAVLTGGESGPAAVSGKPDQSLLIDVVGYRNSIQMPPKSKLPEAEIAALVEWVRRGLPWPNSEPSEPVITPTTAIPADFTDEQKAFWAFQPVKRDLPSVVKNRAWIQSPIDQFILAELESKNLSVSRTADRRTLVRRVTLDLIGLPPAPDEVAQFVQDNSPDALERVVDRLLASPRYGERWARRWLDVARYADSNGLDENLAYANAFRYRDYVVKAMRDDKPYDRFLVEQIAGDLLENQSRETLEQGPPATTAMAAESIDALVATGFLCLGAKMLAEDDPVKMQMDIIDEQVDTIARAVMGLTMGCARCHDHKFDPLTTDDYYGMAGIFKSTQTMDTFTVVARWHERPLATRQEEQHRNELQQLANSAKQAVDKLKSEATETVLTEARQFVGDYLLAATRETQLANLLSAAQPRGNAPNPMEIAGAFLIEAEDFSRGNVQKDRETYGKEIGVLVNRGETPNFAEYDIDVSNAGTYQLELKYAAATARPVKLFVNSKLVKSNAANRVTGSWTPESQTWFVECFVSLNAGRNLIRLEQPQFFPHLDKLLLTPAASADSLGDSLLQWPSNSAMAGLRIHASLTQQWIKVLHEAKSNPNSILTAWNQFVRDQKLTVDPTNSENGVTRLLGDAQPATLAELASRYQLLFADAEQSWATMKASDTGKELTSLADPVLDAAHKLLVHPKGPYKTPADIEALYMADAINQLKPLREELTLKEAAVPKYPEVMAVAELTPENLKIHLRGSHLTLGREVPRQLPRILCRTEARELTNGSGRLQLAQWLTNADHPLTARVMINRIWQWHFGYGLVRSPDNFGRLGERPSHPALLDWLADEFSRNGNGLQGPRAWSIKSAHRLLIGSATYRQNTDTNAAASLTDPENRLLWRFNRQRMDVEVLRDSLLAISGQLDETPNGTLLPTANRAYVTSTANENPAIYNSNRRSIYLPVVRSALFQVFTAFDFADPSTLAGQRDQTTVAPQALFMMNSAFVLDRARAVTKQLLEQNALDEPARICQLYQLVYSRTPSESEVSRGIAYLARIRDAMVQTGVAVSEIELRSWTSFCRAVLSANEFVYVE